MADNKIAIDLLINTDKANLTLGQLEEGLKAANEELRKLPRGSEEFKNLSQQITLANKEVKNLELSMEALDNEQVASEIGSVAGAFGDVSTSLVLLSGNNKTIEEMAANIEFAMGVSVGLKGAIEGISSGMKLWTNLIKTNTVVQRISTIATNLFSKAMNLIPIMLIVTGIGLLIAYFSDLVSWFKKVGEFIFSYIKPAFDMMIDLLQFMGIVESDEMLAAKQREAERKKMIEDKTKAIQNETKKQLEILEKAKEREKKIADEKIESIDYEIRKRKASGEDTATIEKEKLRFLVEAAKREVEIEQKKVDLLQESIRKQLELRGFTLEQAKEFAKTNEASLKAAGITKNMIDSLYGTSDELESSKNNLEKMSQDLEIFNLEQNKKANDIAKKNAEKKANDDKKEKEKALQREKDYQKLLSDIRDQWNNELIASEEETIQAINDAKLTDRQKEENDIYDKYFKLIENAKKYGMDAVSLEEAQQKALQEVKDKYNKIEEDKDKEKANKKKELLSQSLEATMNGLNLLSDISNQNLENELKNAKGNESKMAQIRKKAFERDKKLNVAKALIGGAQAVMQALAGSPPPFNFINAGIVGAATLAQLNAIKNAKFDGDGSLVSAASAASSGGAGGGVPINPVSNTSTMLGDQKVYVTEADISKTQKKVKTIESWATH